MRTRHLLFILAALGPLWAEGPLEVLKLVPTSAESVELTWRPAEATARYRSAMPFLDPKEEVVDLVKIGNLTLQDLAPGTVAVAKFEVAAQPSQSKGKSERVDESVGIFPLKDAKGLLARWKARKAGAFWLYEWTGAEGKEKRFLVLKGERVFISKNKAVLEKMLQPGASLESEGLLLQDWLLRQDSVLLVPEKATRSLLAATKDSGKSKGKLPGSRLLEELGAKARASVHHVAMGLQLPANGSVLLQARAFFKAGSPWAKEAEGRDALPGHPLGLLPEGPFALAMGGEWPRTMDVLNRMAVENTRISAEDRQVLQGMLDRNHDQVQRMSFAFRAPKPGEPFLQGVCSLLEVKDAKAWLEANRAQVTWMAEHLNGMYALQPQCLPEVPSHTLELDLTKLGSGESPNPQMFFLGSMLFGGTKCRISYGQLDEHHVLCVVGGSEVLQAFWDQVRSQPLLIHRPSIQAVDALLPKAANFALYLDPQGLQALAALIAQGLTGRSLDLPKTVSVPPLAGMVSLDPMGIQFSGAARPESLQAMVQLMDSIKKGMNAAQKSSSVDDGGDDKDEPEE